MPGSRFARSHLRSPPVVKVLPRTRGPEAAGARTCLRSGFRDFVDVGGLISYGVDFADLYRRAADYIDMILKGAYPGDIPSYQGVEFNLVLNVKAAKAVGLICLRRSWPKQTT